MAKKPSKARNKVAKNRKKPTKSLVRRTSFSGTQLLIFAAIFAAVGGYAIWKSLAAPRVSQAFAVAETYADRNLKLGCVSEDDNLRVLGNQGYLNPGQSLTYTTKTPDCNNERAINMTMSWGNTKSSKGQGQLKLTAVVPASEKWTTYGSAYYLAEDHTGKVVNATYSGSSAQLCMFSDFQQDQTPRNYSFTITNISTSKISGINFLSTDDNDWPDDWNQCKSDADHDGFSDAYEHYKAYMSEGGHLGQPWNPPVGTNYLKACNNTTAPNDEFDAWPPDANDDNVVTQADVDTFQSYAGQGDGQNWTGINNVPGYYQLSTGSWRRYDLNNDGYVTQADADIVKTYLGKSCPTT
ncbi:hypothetical protein KW801_02490 [Candidatus Saccharibacteria bacterium]|nr:hypothetical protein [Candidatus Saccharibacteria bacterium]